MHHAPDPHGFDVRTVAAALLLALAFWFGLLAVIAWMAGVRP